MGAGRARKAVSLKCASLSPTQFFVILLIIFIAELTAAVVALVYTTMVRPRGRGKGGKLTKAPEKWVVTCEWPLPLPVS